MTNDKIIGGTQKSTQKEGRTKGRTFSGLVGGVLVCCLLLFWLGWNASPANSQGTFAPGLSAEGSVGLAAPGEEVAFRLRLLNSSDGVISDTYLTQVLPSGFSYVANSAQVTIQGTTIQTEPTVSGGTMGGTLIWGPFEMAAATTTGNNPYGIHTFVQDLCAPHFINIQLDQALELAGSGGYVTQLFYRIDANTAGPDPCAVTFVNGAYDRNLNPIVRLQGHFAQVDPNKSWWQKPDPGQNGDYAEVAAAFARVVEGLPRRGERPLYVTIWNEPNVWVEWSGQPNAEEYANFFVAVSKAIRALNDPRIKIMNGPTSPPHDPTPDFIRVMLDTPGFVDAFDVWGSHCYPLTHPAWYNIHNGAAEYPEAAIDSYLLELDILAEYGRTDTPVIIKETGYGLGEDEYAWEGFPTIDEQNRAQYIGEAFDTYWRNWPEVIAATPFELGSPWGGWDWLDWLDYDVSSDGTQISYTPYLQYDTVAALEKPQPGTALGSVEITFRARVADDVTPGIYDSYLYGLVGGGTGSLGTGTLPFMLPVQVWPHIYRIYLPLVMKDGGKIVSPAGGDKGYRNSFSRTARIVGASADGAIIPTHFLTGTRRHLLRNTRQIQAIEAAQRDDRLRNRVVDSISGDALVADAGEGAIIRYSGALSTPVFALPEGDIPDQLLLDADARRLYVTLPGTKRIFLVDADTGQEITAVKLAGGPIIQAILDAEQGRLYILSALTPKYRALYVLQADDLSLLALAVGSDTFPLQRAAVIAPWENGQILVLEGEQIYQLQPALADDDFEVVGVAAGKVK